MRLEVPFFENDGQRNQCYQAAMRSALKFYLDKDYSLEELSTLTGRTGDFWTYTPQIVPVLYNLGLDVKYYSKVDQMPFLEGEGFIRRHYGDDAEKILKFTDVPTLVRAVEQLAQYNLFEKRVLLPTEIENHLSQNHLPLMLLDWNVVAQRTGFYQGHFVAVTGYDTNYMYCHNSGPVGPQAHQQIPKKTFLEAWNSNGTDNDVVVVLGKRDH